MPLAARSQSGFALAVMTSDDGLAALGVAFGAGVGDAGSTSAMPSSSQCLPLGGLGSGSAGTTAFRIDTAVGITSPTAFSGLCSRGSD